MTVLFSSVILGQAQRVPGIHERDVRVKPEHDSIIFSSVILGQAQRVPGIHERDVRGKPEHDRKKNKPRNDNIFFLCLTCYIVAFFCQK